MIDVGSLDEFHEGEMRLVAIGRREIGILRWRRGEVYALRNVCPHQGGPVCRGAVSPKLVAREGIPGVLDVESDVPVIACAWHAWEFDVRTGLPIAEDSRYKVRAYPVKVENGRVLVDAGRRSVKPS